VLPVAVAAQVLGGQLGATPVTAAMCAAVHCNLVFLGLCLLICLHPPFALLPASFMCFVVRVLLL
jgi:hypothetical protein